MHFHCASTITRTYSKRGKQPQVKTCAHKQKASFMGLVSTETGQLFTQECETFNHETITQALQNYLQAVPSNKTRLIVLDNASWHKKAVRLAIESNTFAGKLLFLFLPPYSPDLNPIERVWRCTRRNRTHNRYFPSLKLLKDTLAGYWDKYSIPNIDLLRLCG